MRPVILAVLRDFNWEANKIRESNSKGKESEYWESFLSQNLLGILTGKILIFKMKTAESVMQNRAA